MTAWRLRQVTPDCSVDPVEVVSIETSAFGDGTVILFRGGGQARVKLSIDEVREILRRPR